MKAVGYLRELPQPSLEEQQRAYLDHCRRSGLEVGPTFTEIAGEAGAPEFRRMLRLLERDERGFTVVVVAGFAVFGERAREQARRYLQLAAVGLPLQLASGGDADEALLRAWRERRPEERRRERVREAMRRRALRGEALGRPPYGYRVAGRRLEPHPGEAAVVREIFRAQLDEGEGVRRIARRLNDAGLRTRRGGAWSTASVREILRNPVYAGTYRRLGVVVPGAHEPIIPRERFERAQRLLAARRTSPAAQRRREYLLSGVARCGHCGNRLIGVHRPRGGAAGAGKREYVYYQCESRTNQGRCAYHTRRAEELEEMVRERVARGPAATATAQQAAPAAGRARLESRRRALQRELDRMLERRASGEWTAERLRAAAGAVALDDLREEERAEALERRSAVAQDDAARAAELEQARVRLAERWDDLPFAERRALLRLVVAAVTVTDGAVNVEFVA